jgi:hypothetical protein
VCDLIGMSSAPAFSNPSTLAIPEGAVELSRLMTSVGRSQHFSPLLRGDKLFNLYLLPRPFDISKSLIRICRLTQESGKLRAKCLSTASEWRVFLRPWWLRAAKSGARQQPISEV